MQLELVAVGCADDNVSSILVGEVVDVVGMVVEYKILVQNLHKYCTRLLEGKHVLLVFPSIYVD